MRSTNDKPAVLVGMSGGVDSSVSAALLVRQGFRVVGGFIKNWSDSKDLWTGECQWRAERRDAMRVAAQLGIPLLTFDFEAAYRERVVQELFRGYAAGETPNPDVLCNEAIKFGLFFQEARRLKMEYVATGHYARIDREAHDRPVRLLRGLDHDKDQSYFLYRVPQFALAHTLFPIGHLRKPEVRALAAELDLPVAEKPDSQGICFIGKLDMGEFLRKKIPSHPGEIVDPNGNVLGQHDGLDQYTIGQRQGMKIDAGGHAWYVAQKDVARNRLVIVPDPEHPLLFSDQAIVSDLHWTTGEPPEMPCSVEVQVRYRQHAEGAVMAWDIVDQSLCLRFKHPVKAVAPGQSAVIYQGDVCLGGGLLRGSDAEQPVS